MSRGLGDVYKRQNKHSQFVLNEKYNASCKDVKDTGSDLCEEKSRGSQLRRGVTEVHSCREDQGLSRTLDKGQCDS